MVLASGGSRLKLGMQFHRACGEMNIVLIEALVSTVGLTFCKVRHFTSLLAFFSVNAKRDQRFLFDPSQKIFYFSFAPACFLPTTQVQIPNFGVASPKTRHAVTVLFGPSERQKTAPLRGFLGVASVKMCKHGKGGKT